MKKQTQVSRIIEYMERFGSITALQAMADIGCMRLAARISDIKDMGIGIETKTVNVLNRFGERVSVTEYSIKKENA